MERKAENGTHRKMCLHDTSGTLARIQNVCVGRDEVFFSKAVDVGHHVFEVGGEIDFVSAFPHFLNT